MKERPILFNAPMVRAILAGTKTQTRRVVKPNLLAKADICKIDGPLSFEDHFGDHHSFLELCPYGQPGDRLWVRETWRPIHHAQRHKETYVRFKADDGILPVHHDLGMETTIRWKPSIHMPRWASRITLEIVSVRVERLTGISEEDARSEGYDGSTTVPGQEDLNCRAWFEGLWDSVYGKGEFRENPRVWVVEFKRVKP